MILEGNVRIHMEDRKDGEQNKSISAREKYCVSKEKERQKEKERGGKRESKGGKAGRKTRKQSADGGEGAEILRVKVSF